MNPYPTLSAFVTAKRLVLPSPKTWWLLSDADAVTGEVNGVPSLRGVAVATNGILIAVETVTGTVLFGHRDWFVVDKEPKDTATGRSTPRPSTRQQELAAKYA